MTDPLQAVLFPPRKPGWLLCELRHDWRFDLELGDKMQGYPHLRTIEIQRNADHGLAMLNMVFEADLAARKNAEERSYHDN